MRLTAGRSRHRRTIADALGSPRNGFTIVRLALALAVVVSHAFSVASGDVGAEPLARLTGFTLGEHAVNGFFAISGFLVTMSFVRRGPRDYVLSRALRIAPGLVAATLVVALGVGAVATSLSVTAYYRDPSLWRFVAGTLTTFKSNASLPGVFAANPFAFPMGTVWTLKYEVLCYAGVLAAGLGGLLRRPLLAALLAGALLAAVLVLDVGAPGAGKSLQTALRLPAIFAAGGALWLWREEVPASAPLALAGLTLAAAVSRMPAYHAVLFGAEAYAAIILALAPTFARPGLDPADDLSYGVYLYGWPVQQALLQAMPRAGAFALLLPALALSLAVAGVSWRLVERPALHLKARALGRRNLGTQDAPRRTRDASHPATPAAP